jgi:HEAT repeat protein
MLPTNLNRHTDIVEKNITFATLPLEIEAQPDRKLEALLADLSPDTPWVDRQAAARKLGYMRNPEALPGLLAALPTDPFWMVRCAIIQALECIGDSLATPTLREIAKSDGFQVVRSYAATAIERLSQ